LLLSFDLRNANIEEECGTDGVDPEEQDNENASAHSYLRYVCCMIEDIH
jgi:hypothetical protein